MTTIAYRFFKPVITTCLGIISSAVPLYANDLIIENHGTKSSLIELYSSEGCSSCPPAEAWLNRLKNDPGLWKTVYPLAFHVDYWDGLGWPDRFARAEYTQRQRDYASRLGQESVYTPEFVVNGLEWRHSWFNGRLLPYSGEARSGALSLMIDSSKKQFMARYQPEGIARPAILHVALLGMNLSTDVQRGENAGSKLEHDFVVLSLQFTPLLKGADGAYCSSRLDMKSSTQNNPEAVVAWVEGTDGTILQIAGGGI